MPDAHPEQTYPVKGRDVTALIGIAILEAESQLGQLQPGVEQGVTSRLAADGLLPRSASTPAAMRVALGNLAQRLHAAYGAYPDGPPQQPLP